MAKPADFYVGVTELFSIVLPGAIVCWIGWLWAGKPAGLVPEEGAARWVAFILAAYAAGHIVFLFAAYVDATFDPFRRLVLPHFASKDRLAARTKLRDAAIALRRTCLATRDLSDVVDEELLSWARALVPERPGVPTIPDVMNAYQWSCAALRLRAPAAYAEVARYEADSKFFRSLFVVLLAPLLLALLRLPVPVFLSIPLPVVAFLAVLTYCRYAERRLKCIDQAYRSVIVFLAMNCVEATAMQPKSDAQAAGDVGEEESEGQ